MAYFLLHSGQPSAKKLLKRVSRLKPYPASHLLTGSDVVIRWGSTKDDDAPYARWMNSGDANSRTTSRSVMNKILRRMGIRIPTREQIKQGEIRFLRHYRVPLFDLAPLACFRADTGMAWINQRIQRVQESFREVSPDNDKASTRVMHLAMRALHALGLDHGLVSIGMASHGILYVVDITPNPVLDAILLPIYADAVEQFIDQDEGAASSDIPDVVLGTDIEVMLRNEEGKMVLASNYFPRKGRIGCDDRSVHFDGTRLPLMEFRPEPDRSPLGLVDNLRQAMVDASSMINRSKVEWRAGSMPFRPYCTGGHIHFSNIAFSSRIVKALDNYLGLPLLMIEDRRTAQLRRPRYGYLGDVRFKDHGGFEYRTPASFVLDSDVTTAAFCIAYLIATHERELPVSDIYEPDIQSAFYHGDSEALMPIVEGNIAAIRDLPAYERYEEYIEPLFQMIERGQIWDEEADVRAAWGIPVRQRSAKRPDKRRTQSRISG